jgi:hypothetical protein
MKKSELRQIIREELENVIQEENLLTEDIIDDVYPKFKRDFFQVFEKVLGYLRDKKGITLHDSQIPEFFKRLGVKMSKGKLTSYYGAQKSTKRWDNYQ